MTATIIILSVIVVIMLLVAVNQRAINKGLSKTNHNYWAMYMNMACERDKMLQKESVRCKIIAGKNETIADLEEQVNQKNWQIEKLQDDLAVSHRHYENLKQELQATHEHYENMYAELVSI